MIHCVDELRDIDEILNGKVFEYVLEMKKAEIKKYFA